MKLLGSLTSPFVRKVRIVMAEKKLDYHLLIEDVWADNSEVAQYNPLAKVPCLIMDDYGSLFDSRVIVEYLDTLSPVGRLIPQGGRDRASVKCWEAIADGLTEAAAAIYAETHRRPEALRFEDWIQRQQRKIHAALQHMDENLGEQAFCTGISFTLADVAVGCALGYLDMRFPNIAWRDSYANLNRLYDKLSERPSFSSTLAPATA